MFRAISGIGLASLLIAFTFTSYWLIAFPVIFVSGLVFGIPTFMALRKLGWLRWWHASLAGILCAIPLVAFYLGINPGHTQHVGLYNSVYAISGGFAGGAIAWLAVVFKNPEYPGHDDFPKSIVMMIPIMLAFFVYRSELEPEYLHGCIVGYEAAENPTSWEYAYAEVALVDGSTAKMSLTVGYSKPEIVGNCAWYSVKKNALLTGVNYSLHSTDSIGQCMPPCPNQTGS